MKIFKACLFRLEPTPEQALLFAKTAGCCRVLYNIALIQRSTTRKQQHKSLSYADQCGELKALKKDYPSLELSLGGLKQRER